MASVNKVILIGNAGKDPEVRYTANGAAICNLSIATSRSWKDKNTGEKQEETEWHRVVFYDKLAEIAGQYITKGRTVYVEGRLKTRKWADKDGIEKYTTEIIGAEMVLLGGRQERDQEQEQPKAPPSRPPSRPPGQQKREAAAGIKSGTGFDDMDDDIPY